MIYPFNIHEELQKKIVDSDRPRITSSKYNLNSINIRAIQVFEITQNQLEIVKISRKIVRHFLMIVQYPRGVAKKNRGF